MVMILILILTWFRWVCHLQNDLSMSEAETETARCFGANVSFSFFLLLFRKAFEKKSGKSVVFCQFFGGGVSDSEGS